MQNPKLFETLADLIRINSVNSAYAHGTPEAQIQHYIYDFFAAQNIEVFEQPVAPGRANIIARLAGRDASRRIIFEAHSDTVGIEGMTIPPFEPTARDGRLYGRGACDTKGGLAAMMHALADLHRDGFVPPCEIWVVAAVDEEHAGTGALRLCEGLSAAAAVVAEPTGLKMVVVSKGCLRWRMIVRGRAAHSSKPNLGVNAIQHMAPVLAALESYARSLACLRHPLVGEATMNVGLIEGGTQVNIVPESCWIAVDRRLLPGEDPAMVLAACEALLDQVRAERPDLEVIQESPMVGIPPLETPLDSSIVQHTAEILRAAGLNPSPVGVPFGSDASRLAPAGIPSIIFGPGSIDQAHTADEHVEIEQVEQAFSIYRALMRQFE